MHLTQLARPSAAHVIAFGLIACLLLPITPKAEPSPKAAMQFHIPKQKLIPALTAFAEQSGVQLLYNAELAEALSTSGINGSYAPQQALTFLLKGTGITYHYVDKNIITLEYQAKDKNNDGALLPVVQVAAHTNDNIGSDTTLSKVTVEADAEYAYDPEYYTDPYNKDYVIPNATAGTKTDTPIMETPLNVQVISKQVLKDQQVITLADSLKNVSGVVVNKDGGAAQLSDSLQGGDLGITLRGFESTTFFRNGFRLQNGNKAMANVESVEVLKGPAAILYGLVEPGGMVNVVTKQPLTTPYYAFNQQFGSYDNYRTTLDATGPITNNKDVLYRMNMSYQNSGSWQDFVGKEDIFLAPVLKWIISPKTQVTAEFEYNRQHQGLAGSYNPYINGQLLSIPLSRNYGAYSPAVNESFFGGINWSHQFNDDWVIKHSIAINQQGFAATNFTSPFLTMDVGGGLGVVRDFHRSTSSQNNTYSTNLDLTGHFDTFGLKHTLLLGGDYYRTNINLNFARPGNAYTFVDPFYPVNPGLKLGIPDFNNLDENHLTDQYGIYAQDQIQLPYNVHVTGGIRYQNLHQTTASSSYDGTVDANGAVDSSRTNTSGTAKSQDAVTPRVGILWHPQSWISLYANYAESFGANQGVVWGASGQFKPVAPTSAEQYEGGIKTEFFDGRLRATLAYYDLTKTNVATSDPLHPSDCPGGCMLAIGAIRSRGPELDIQGEILPGWNAIATYTNTDIIVTKTNEKNEPLNGMNVGSRMINVPRNTASFWNTYEFQDSNFKGLKFGAGVTVREGQIGSGGQKFNDAGVLVQNPIIKTPGYATLDLMTAYSRAIGNSKITVQLNINNLLDKRYFSSINAGWNDPSNQMYGAYAVFGAPRTFMGSINIQY